MSSWVLIPDTGMVMVAIAAVTVSLVLPGVMRRARRLRPARRARLLIYAAVAPWLFGVAGALMAFLPTVAFEFGLVWDWCLDRAARGGFACPMHPDTIGVGAAAWLLLVPFGALAIVLAWDAWRLSRQARGLSLQLDAVTTRVLDGDVRVVDTPRALAAATAWPCRRIYVSESALARLNGDEVHALFEHERAHIRRRDSYFLLLARLSSVLLMPSTRRRLLEELHLAVEQACDRQAARVVGAEVVASALIKFARLAQQPVPEVVSSFGVDIGSRVEALLDPREDNAPPRWRLQAACLFAVLPASWVLHELGEWLLLPLVR